VGEPLKLVSLHLIAPVKTIAAKSVISEGKESNILTVEPPAPTLDVANLVERIHTDSGTIGMSLLHQDPHSTWSIGQMVF